MFYIIENIERFYIIENIGFFYSNCTLKQKYVSLKCLWLRMNKIKNKMYQN